MKYTAINIGPIIDTFSMAKRPRELWNASYMFSYLMECIINNILEVQNARIISPAVINRSKPFFNEAGLYPDRVFIDGEINVNELMAKALSEFKAKTGVGNEYVNVMSVSIEYEEPTGAIKELNRLLDCLELYQRPGIDKGLKDVASLLHGNNKEILYNYATGKLKFTIPSLAEIATHRLKHIDSSKWLETSKKLDNNFESEAGEDAFYQLIKEQFKDVYKSYYKYICVIQADGDNMGKIISALETSKVKTLSESLLEYASDACKLIRQYGGLPIYAGGDDLLFIAPVVSSIDLADAEAPVESFLSEYDEGKKSPENTVTYHDLFAKVLKVDSIGDKPVSIFNLLDTIDELYKKVDDTVGNLGRPSGLHTSISYGLSISYYKYPLYEALKNARELLFDKAKNVEGKNAIAWCLRKHSGSGFAGSFCKGTKVYTVFSQLLEVFEDKTIISAVAHRLYENVDLLNIIYDKYQDLRNIFSSYMSDLLDIFHYRLGYIEQDSSKIVTNLLSNLDKRYSDKIKAFYQNIMDEDFSDSKSYKGITCELLWELFRQEKPKTEKLPEIIEILYSMLRTAKFINGEGDSNE